MSINNINLNMAVNMGAFELYGIPIPTDVDLQTLDDIRKHLLLISKDILIAYEEFISKRVPKIVDLAEQAIVTSLSDNPAIIKKMIDDANIIAASVGRLRTDAQAFLTIFETMYSLPKDRRYNDIDRKQYAKTRTVTQQSVLSKLENLESRLDKRISIGQSALKHETAAISRGMGNAGS